MEETSALRALGSVLRDLNRDLVRAGRRIAGVAPLPETETDIVRLVVRRPGVSPGQIAAELRMQPSNVSAALRHLTAAGLVTRESDPMDRRATRVRPTPQAVENARLMEEARAGLLHEALNDLAAEHQETLLHAIPSLRALENALRDRV
ncbi:MarR family winged helix-turn-helix transcriptional regulator [Planobispora longispora]|uniref:MarR family transcriptional regulator n=1 Tax=Planobispora longispora TaxID=28887 RepID=A0A8J3W8J3_9ACTN|nr:MarR family transcriptional regulator [Planobispora longispora]BFE82419.1 MarR family winged helix-turn-helix transcriptional regulator [Planobispora longispora]GIH78916.1 MarR family transcriptional regulator [Planobispora longispora]